MTLQATPAGFTKRAGGTIDDAHRQWATRPAEEAVHTVDDLVTRTQRVRALSRTKANIPWESLRVEADGQELALVGKGGTPAYLGNWAMGQLASVAGAPAGYLSKLPAQLAAECLTHGLKQGVERDNAASLLVTVSPGRLDARAILTDRYERVWDAEIAERIATICQKGTWGPAQAFRSASTAQVSHAWGTPKPLPLGWVGDRSMFALLVDYEGSVTTKAGQKLARFVMLENSEVGARAVKATLGLLDFVCGNMIMWGCSDVYEARFRHTKNVHEKLHALSAPMTARLGSGEQDKLLTSIAGASATLLGEDKDSVVERVVARTKLPKQTVIAAYGRVEATSRYGDPRSAWGMVQGLTEESQGATFADDRIDIDRAAAKLLAGF